MKEIFTEVFSVASSLPDTPVELEIGIKTAHMGADIFNLHPDPCGCFR